MRSLIQNNIKIKIGFNIQHTSIVNFIASFFLGIFVAFDFMNNNLILLFYTGFLGCFSTFSTFILKEEIQVFNFSLSRGNNTFLFMFLFRLLYD